VFIGAVLASFLTEVIGMLVAILAPSASTPIAALKTAMGGFGAFAVVAVILGATTANVLNLYSNTMSAKVLDVRLQRWLLAIIGGVLGFVLALIGFQNFTQNYENFLIVLDYWIMPWLAVILLDFYVFGHREPMGFSQAVPVNWNGLVAWLIGLGVSLLFISEQFQVLGLKAHGPLAKWFGDADFGYFIGFIVAGVVYVLLNRGASRGTKP
jgi:NCS1 family nucleobase:cation symporter-1